MSGNQAVERVAAGLIRASCRRLPPDDRAEYCREWSAELPAILGDTSVRLPIVRALRALRYSAGISSTTWHLRRAGGRLAAPRVRLAIGVLIWLVFVIAVVSLVRAFPRPHPGWPLIIGGALGGGFAACCLTDLARVPQVRHLPKWGWALICLAQIPLGGIVYLCIGRAGAPRSSPPSAAGQL